jgi:hypothetical protein
MTLKISQENKMTTQKGKRGNPKAQKTGIVTDSSAYELQMAKLGNSEQCLFWNVDKCERGLTRIVTVVCNDFKHWRSDERNW